MHGAGGNVLLYRDLSLHLGADQPFYGLQSIGTDGSRPPLTRIEEMAALYVAEIRKVQPTGPYFLGGYCGGGTIAFEVAQQLVACGETVALLALFDTMNWSKIPLTMRSRGTYHFQRLSFHARSFLRLNFSEKARFFREKTATLRSRIPIWRGMLLAKFGRKSAGPTSGALALASVWLANDLACWNYHPRPFSGKITDFRPEQQYRLFDRPGLKWEEFARGGHEVVLLPVYPAGMLVEPFVKHLSAALTKAMDSAISAFHVR
jgi:phthiocerol/phenolphthiocerol synthesis type-I polyketide synthase E